MSTLRLITWNVNGLRSVVRGDFEEWLERSEADVVCLQEVKVEADLLTRHWFPGYVAYWNGARRQGYSGVATLVREGLPVEEVVAGMAHPESDAEGRLLSVDVKGIRLINVYAPHSHRKLTRLDAKMRFLNALTGYVTGRRSGERPLVVMGDMNIAHLELDLANSKANAANAGFRPEERAWLDGFLADGFKDGFRLFNQDGGHYTWWSMRTGVRERNVGWRLDYAFVEDALADRAVGCRHMTERRGSDHCPVELVLSI